MLDAAVAMAVHLCTLSPLGLTLTKDTLWGSLEVGSLQTAVDLENRTQLLAGFTGNLTEAAAAFKEKRPPRLHRVVRDGQGPPGRKPRRPTATGRRAAGREHWRADGSPKTRFRLGRRGQPGRPPGPARGRRPSSTPTSAGSAAHWHLGNADCRDSTGATCDCTVRTVQSAA